MVIFSILGVIFSIAGLLFLFWPEAITKIDEWGERVLFSSKGTTSHRIATGIFFLIAATLMFFFAYMIQGWSLLEFLKQVIF